MYDWVEEWEVLTMKPPPFDYHCPENLEAALALLSEHGDSAKILAGGQSLVPMLNLRVLHPDVLIDINGLPGLDYIRLDGGKLAIGALARHRAVHDSAEVREICPLMAAAYPHVSHGPIRNRGTLCGNLCHSDPASEMPAVALACDAEFLLQSTAGTRELDAEEFLVGALTTAARPDEMLVEVRLPPSPAGQGWSFQEVSARKGDFAYVAAGATLQLDGEVCGSVRLCFAGVGDGPHRARDAEEALLGAVPTDDAFAQAAEIAAEGIDPSEDYHADAAYRRDLVRSLTRRTLAEALSRCT
jgi:carbon-monoxide dehydrogenase medium subunit